MTYAKPIMRLAELKKMGYPEEFLLNAYRNPSQAFAWKMDITKKNSPILFDTEGLEQYRLTQIKNERMANSHRIVL